MDVRVVSLERFDLTQRRCRETLAPTPLVGKQLAEVFLTRRRFSPGSANKIGDTRELRS